MMLRVAHLCRHPIKSAGHEEVGEVALASGRAFPFDREWAVAHAAAKFGAEGPGGWASKMNFLRGWGSADLMAIACRSDPAARRVTLSHPAQGTVEGAPDDPADAARLVDWLRPLWPATRPEPDRILRVAGQAMTDVPDPWIAVLNLASLRALAAAAGADLSIHRFRGNLWLDGLPAWEEFGLVGRRMQVGTAVIEGVERIGRCRATEANPGSGQFDVPVLRLLEAGWGHADFGVYARVVQGGPVAQGDTAAWLD